MKRKAKVHTLKRASNGKYIQEWPHGMTFAEAKNNKRIFDIDHYFPNMKGGHSHRRNYELCVWGCGRYTKHVWCDDLEMFIPGECKRCQRRRAIHRKVQEEFNK